MERALGLPATSLPCRGSSQNKFAANCIIAVSNFNFPHGILPNGTAKTVFRVQCHRNRRNCSDGSQFFPQKQVGCMDFIISILEQKENKLHVGLQYVNLQERLILPCLLPQIFHWVQYSGASASIV